MHICFSCGHRYNSDQWTCPNCGHLPELIDGHLAFAPDLARSNTSYNPEYFAQLDENIEKSFWIIARKHLFLWAMKKYFSHAETFLELGCATGMVLAQFRNEFETLKLSGCDIFTQALALVDNLVSGTFVFQADACKLPFEKEYDVIAAFDLLEHVEDDTRVLAQMFQAVKSGGGIIISVPQHHFLWGQRDEFLCHKRRYTRKELFSKTQKAGFDILKITSFITLPFPAMLLENFTSKRHRKDYHPLKALQINHTLNYLLIRLLAIEKFMIKCNISFPFGGSLLLVAKRIE